MKKSVLITIISAVVSANASVVMAEIFPALDLERNGTGYTLASNRTYGWEFSVTEDIAVTGLGIFDLFDDGLDFSHEIGIWHTGEPVLSATVPGGTETLLIDQFRYVHTEPFWLAAGETYVIGACGLGDPYVGNDGSARITTISSITYERTLFSPSGSGFTLPTLVQDEFYLFGPNFLVIPEPMTLVMFSLGGLFLVRKRSR